MGSGTERRLFASPLRVPLYLIRKGYRRTSFCVTLKGATLSYPQGYQAWLSFLFSASLLFFFRRYGEFVVFSAEKVRNTYSFLWLRYADIVKRQRKMDGKRKYRGTYNRTTLPDIGTGYFPGAEGREFASVGPQKYV